MNKTNKYDDIINLPHHVSTVHPHMPIIDRAAQFSPFAALTGHESAIKETARLTEQRIEMDENRKVLINEKLQILANQLSDQPIVSITYFLADEKKDGGAYITVTENIKKIDSYLRCIVLSSGVKIPIDDLWDVASSLFETENPEISLYL